MEEFKQLSPIQRLIKGGVPKEYSAHLVPSTGTRIVKRFYANGIILVGDAAGLVLNTGLNLEGVNFAIASGIAAAETIKHAMKIGDFSESRLAEYETRLKNSFVLRDLKNHRKSPDTLSNQRIYDNYPSLFCRFFEKVYSVNDQQRKMLWQVLGEAVKESGIHYRQIAKDLIKIGRTL